ncbi:hypothetical protein [Flavobacterium sp.]|uniref:hypothetical protein n=1 Tax=Flavobacterium sp. TaxID=239 RepID=UPI00404796D2
MEYNTGISLKNSKNEDITYAEIIMTKIMACSNLKKHLAVGEEFCNLGLATINFASEYCELTTVSENKKGIFQFKKGELKTKKIELFESETTWTKIHIKPDPSLFEGLYFTSDGIHSKAEEIKTKMDKLDFSIEDITK